MIEQLSKYLKDNFHASHLEIEQVVSVFKCNTAKKNEILITAGDICRYSFFVNKGSVRTFFMDEDGQESTRYIAFENQFITTVNSFILQTPSVEFIQAIESTEFLQISYKDFKNLVAKTTLARDLYIKQLETAYVTNFWRLESFLKMTAK